MINLRFAPLAHPALIAVGLLVALVLVAVFYRRLRPVTAARTWWLLLGTKLLSLALLAAALLNPYFVQRQPDATGLRLAVLYDATGSMNSRDCDDATRLDIVNGRVLAADGRFQRDVLARYPLRSQWAFAGDHLDPLPPDAPLATQPGPTDVDGALNRILPADSDPGNLGAVLLITDGQDNVALSLVEGAERYRKAGIPVHVIGVGDPRARPDLDLQVLDVPRDATRGRPFTLSARLTRNTNGAATTHVVLYDGARQVAEQDVVWNAEERERTVTFERTDFTAGFKTYKLRADPLPAEDNTLNNTDFAGFLVKDPDVFKVLYFAANLDYNFTYLNRLAEDQDRLHLDAMVRLGEASWLHRSSGLGDPESDANTEPAPPSATASPTAAPTPAAGPDLSLADVPISTAQGLPEADSLNTYDCLILQLAALYLIDDAGWQRITDFVEKRGGGLLLYGQPEDPADLPLPLQRLIPLKTLALDTILTQPEPLTLKDPRVLAGERPDGLRELAAHLPVPGDSSAYAIGTDALKPGANRIAEAAVSGWQALVGQQYGAGKVAYLNLDDTWRWVLGADTGDWYHGLFWGRLIVWLASSSKDRLVLKPSGRKLGLGDAVEFAVDVLDDSYTAANDARLSATVLAPSGHSEPLTFWQDPRVDGRYIATWIPRETGEHRLSLDANLPVGDPLSRIADYVVVDRGIEAQPGPLAEMKLQGLARLTGGEYWNWRDLDRIDRLPLSDQVKSIETRTPWLDSWIFLLALALLVLPDWFHRRRIGLR